MSRAAVRVRGAFVVALATAACARYEPAPLDPGGIAAAFAERRLGEPALREILAAHGVAPDDRGWSTAALAVAALYFQPGVARAREGWRAAQAAEVTAGARPAPGVEGDVGRRIAGDEVVESPWVASLGSIVTLELGGKRGARIAAARARTAMREAELEGVALGVAAAVRAARVATATAEERLADATLELAQVTAVAARARERYERGTASRLEGAQVEAEEAAARARVAEARSEAAAARVALARAVGVPAAALDGERLAESPLPVCPPADVSRDSLQALALRRRPDLGRALAEYAVAGGELRLAVAGAAPDLALGPGFAWDQGVFRWVLGLALPAIPLHRNRGPIAEATARRAEAAARFADVQQTVIGELSAALAECGAATLAVASADSVLAAATRRAELARAAYERGEIGLGEVDLLELARVRALRERHAAGHRQAAAALALETAIAEPPAGLARWPDVREDWRARAAGATVGADAPPMGVRAGQGGR